MFQPAGVKSAGFLFPGTALFLACPFAASEEFVSVNSGAFPAGSFAPLRTFLARFCGLLLAVTSLGAVEFSEPAPLASHALLLDITKAGDRLVAVGAHGIVIVSSDQGAKWIQSAAPTRAMLTGVAFADAQHGWAVGHDGVILATTDGGVTWTHQDKGDDLETVYLDVLFLDAQRGFVVGAYGKFLTTDDGGKTWTPGKPVADEVHFNRIARGDQGQLFLAGESGTLLVSSDGGKKWTRSEVPYEGSLFAAVPVGATSLVVGGLRGHILTSPDNGGEWEQHDSDVTVLVMGGTVLKSGAVVLGGQGGNFFFSRDEGKSFTHWKPDTFGSSVAEVIEAADGMLVVVGEAGVARLKLP